MENQVEAGGVETVDAQPSRFAGSSLLFLYSSKADPYFTHRVSIENYAAAYAKRGIRSVVLDMTAPDFMARFAETAPRPDVVAVHCEQSWGLDLATGSPGADMFEYLNKPALAHIRDYPFYPWLRTRTLVPRGNRLLFFTEKSAVDFVAPFRGTPGPANRFEFAPHIYLESGSSAATDEDRPIDLLYVGSYADPGEIRRKFTALQPDFAKALDAIIDRTAHDHYTPFWKSAAGIAADCGIAPDHGSPAYLDLLVAANQFIRNERRRVLLERLAPHPMHLVWSGPRPAVTLHSDTVVTAGNTLPSTLALCAKSKAMVMCLNNFPYSLSERLLSAMHQGAVVLCHGNAMIDQTFRDGEDILMLDAGAGNVDDQLARLKDADFTRALSDAARRKVMASFSPDVRVGQFLSALDDFYGARAP
jgi:hypothetical protein